jgi:hypothetical protein
MTLGYGWKAQIGVGHEVAWGTPVARTRFIELVDVGGGLGYPLLQPDTFRGRSPKANFRGAQLVEGSIASELQYEGWEDFLYHLFGKVATSVVNAIYQHDFTCDDDTAMPVGLTVEAVYGDAATHLWEGCKVDTGEFSFDIDKIVRASFGVAGQTVSAGVKTAATYPTAPLIMWHEVLIKQDAVSKNCISAQVNISNGYIRDRRALGSVSVLEHAPGRREVTGSITADFEDPADWYDLLASDSEFELIITGTSATQIPGSTPADFYDFILTVPAVKLNTHETPISDAGPIRATMNWQARNDGAGGEIVSLRCTNARSTVP